jgi:hypothetical protein
MDEQTLFTLTSKEISTLGTDVEGCSEQVRNPSFARTLVNIVVVASGNFQHMIDHGITYFYWY